MKKRIIFTGSLYLILLLQSASAGQSLQANRTICSPQSADMSQEGYVESVCDWSRWMPGDDVNPIITLNGQREVYADCEFFGSDAIAYVQGTKHAKIKRMPLPGNHFNFIIDYDDYRSSDDNQNIIFYLNTKYPDYNNQMICHFYSPNYLKAQKK